MRLHIHSSIEYNMTGEASHVYYLRRILVTVHTVASDSVPRQNTSFDLSYIRSTTVSNVGEKMKAWLVSLFLVFLIDNSQVVAKILTECEIVKQLEQARISRSDISSWICLMQSESGLNTNLITGPKTASSYSYGIFQINSAKWCSRGHSGGICKKRCEDFANDDIRDDIVCAKKIQNLDGFKAWSGWVKNCKKKPLPNIQKCSR